MKLRLTRYLAAALLAIATAACGTEADEPQVNDKGNLTISVTPMVQMSEVPWDDDATRSLSPLDPKIENTIKSVAIFQFDSEGNLQEVPGTGEYFRYYTLTSTTNPDGVLSLTMPVTNFYDQDRGNSVVCVLANVPESVVRSKLYPRGSTDPIDYREFQNVTLTLPYATDTQDGGEVGLVESMYMFGYYEGRVTQADQKINIALGRLISRLNITFKIGEGATFDPAKKLYLALMNVSTEAQVVFTSNPMSTGKWQETKAYAVPTDFSTGTDFNCFFYVAPVMKNDISEAVRMKMWYTDTRPDVNSTADYEEYLCTEPPSSSLRDFKLNRNCVYDFIFTLTNK